MANSDTRFLIRRPTSNVLSVLTDTKTSMEDKGDSNYPFWRNLNVDPAWDDNLVGSQMDEAGSGLDSFSSGLFQDRPAEGRPLSVLSVGVGAGRSLEEVQQRSSNQRNYEGLRSQEAGYNPFFIGINLNESPNFDSVEIGMLNPAQGVAMEEHINGEESLDSSDLSNKRKAPEGAIDILSSGRRPSSSRHWHLGESSSSAQGAVTSQHQSQALRNNHLNAIYPEEMSSSFLRGTGAGLFFPPFCDSSTIAGNEHVAGAGPSANTYQVPSMPGQAESLSRLAEHPQAQSPLLHPFQWTGIIQAGTIEPSYANQGNGNIPSSSRSGRGSRGPPFGSSYNGSGMVASFSSMPFCTSSNQTGGNGLYFPGYIDSHLWGSPGWNFSEYATKC